VLDLGQLAQRGDRLAHREGSAGYRGGEDLVGRLGAGPGQLRGDQADPGAVNLHGQRVVGFEHMSSVVDVADKSKA
jgi:hypothetical protein